MLPSFPVYEIAVMDSKQRLNFFEKYARYIEDASKNGPHYAIRVGSTTLYNNDTWDLRAKFEKYVYNLRRKLKLKIKK